MDSQPFDHAEASVSQRGSRATSPGGHWRDVKDTRVVEVAAGSAVSATDGDHEMTNGDDLEPRGPTRYKPRTFPYRTYLPYKHEDNEYPNLDLCIKQLYIAVAAGDFIPGATHWTRELKGWLSLKFELPRQERIKLVKLYYELALAPGMEVTAADRFSSMFMTLTKRKHYLRPGEDVQLDWRPLWREIRSIAFPQETNSIISVGGVSHKRTGKSLHKLCGFAQTYFDPAEIGAIFEEILPYFSTSCPEHAFSVIAAFNLLLPSNAPPLTSEWQPQHFLPTLFHLWSLIGRSKFIDLQCLDLLSRQARDCLTVSHVSHGAFGLFTHEQASTIFTAVLRVLEIPVSQVNSPYSPSVDVCTGMAALLERDQRKHPVAHAIARWIVMSLTPLSATAQHSVLTQLEGLLQATETFFHPSNQGAWTKTLSQLAFYLADFFVMRWNRERTGEMATPADRKLNGEVKRRFVLCLREVTFMGIFAKSTTAMSFALSALQNLSYLEPKLILPGALQRIYPSLRGTVEVHRTTSSIRALRELTRIIVQTKGFRCHITSLLGLALPGIDANDLDKTMHTLTLLQAVFNEIPVWPLSRSKKIASDEDDHDPLPVDGTLAINWVTDQIDRLEAEGANVEIDYDAELTDEDEEAIVISSTADFQTFVSSLLDRVFTLLRNLPDAARLRSGSPEENVANTLPAAFTPLFSTMSPELYEMALNKVADFVSKNVIYQARDAMSYVCSSLCKVDPKKALGVLIPILCRNIRIEIEDNEAGSSRQQGTEVLPRDKALVWNISILGMSLVHTGSAIVDFSDELIGIAEFMRTKVKGIPASHASNLIHHILLTLTTTYTVDASLYEESELTNGVVPSMWAKQHNPYRLNIKWHYVDQQEVDFAIRLYTIFAEREVKLIQNLIGPQPAIKRDGTGKDWSDELSRSLVVLRLVVSGASSLYDSRHSDPVPQEEEARDEITGDLSDLDLGATEDEDVKPSFQYPTGYPLTPGSPQYRKLHDLRREIGELLHEVHLFLAQKQQDDVIIFNALYTAYRSWFTDVGIERSAHTLERVTRLFVADSQPFKISGLRKEFPRPLLVRRANVYHLQRQKHNASPRPKTQLDILLLQDLVQSSVSHYTEIRKTAQTAIEASMKVIIGARPVLIPPFLDHFESSVKANDFPRIKGSIFSLLFGALVKSVGRDWRFTPRLIRSYIDAMDVDRPSIQKLVHAATIQVMDMTRQGSVLVILDPTIIATISPDTNSAGQTVTSTIERRKSVIHKRKEFLQKRRKELGLELAEMATAAHWRKESRISTLVIGLELRFDDLANDTAVDLAIKGAVETHPQLRLMYNGALIGLLTYVDLRAISGHSRENFLLEKRTVRNLVKLEPDREDPDWTSKFLARYSQPDADVYIDQDYPGWLVWGKYVPGFKANESSALEYDDKETHVRQRIGSHLDREWFSKFFSYQKQEPRDGNQDRFRMTNVVALTGTFNIVFSGLAQATFEDLKDLVQEVYGDGSDKHQHRATAEILGSLLNCAVSLSPGTRTQIWEYCFPLVKSILEDGITPDNQGYWSTFVDVVVQNRDPRRAWPLIDWLSNYRIDQTSNAAFKESSKIIFLEHTLLDVGWHYQLDGPLLDNFLSNLDHPYKGVREVMGQTLACIYRTHFNKSFKDIPTLMEAQKSASSIGQPPYALNDTYKARLSEVFEKIEKWRHERSPGTHAATPYTSGSKTALSWIESTLSSYECTQLIPFFPHPFLEALLHMMDIKEDSELGAHAYSVFRQLPNIPFRTGEESEFVDALIRIGKTAASWHQRLRIMIDMQAIYYRLLFLMPLERQQAFFDCIAQMLEDPQLEVRVGAGTTLSGLLRCSPAALRSKSIAGLIERFSTMLAQNPLPRNIKNQRGPTQASTPLNGTSRSNTPSLDGNRAVVLRHAAVLGLGALIQAFPYASPPMSWMPSVLTTLANKAAGDPGVVGKSAKGIVSDFKKTRQDTWHIDVKAFEPEQLEDLEGVLWKSYFA